MLAAPFDRLIFRAFRQLGSLRPPSLQRLGGPSHSSVPPCAALLKLSHRPLPTCAALTSRCWALVGASPFSHAVELLHMDCVEEATDKTDMSAVARPVGWPSQGTMPPGIA